MKKFSIGAVTTAVLMPKRLKLMHYFLLLLLRLLIITNKAKMKLMLSLAAFEKSFRSLATINEIGGWSKPRS